MATAKPGDPGQAGKPPEGGGKFEPGTKAKPPGNPHEDHPHGGDKDKRRR